MTHPFWILNNALLLLLGCVSGFIYFSDTPVPERESIESSKPVRKEKSIQINIRKIYENDLFGTYQKELGQRQSIDFGPPLPQAPRPERFEVPEITEPEFLNPLNITLKGIVVVGTHDVKNRAIIEQNNTKQEIMIKVGDSFEDAQLIQIFKNKIVFLRSNGQQEILYLREQDAKLDPSYTIIDNWDDVIKKTEENSYLIDPQSFVLRVTNLSQFIHLLGLTTAYKNGASFGCHITATQNSSLAYQLGLKKGDILTGINNNSIATVAERLSAYKEIITLRSGDTIVITVLRNQKEVTLTYTLKQFMQETNSQKEDKKTTVNHKDKQIIKPNKSYAHINMKPTTNKIRSNDRTSMMVHGKKPTTRGSL